MKVSALLSVFSLLSLHVALMTLCACSRAPQAHITESASAREAVSDPIDLVDLKPWAETLRLVVQGEDVLYPALRSGEPARASLDQFLEALKAPIDPSAPRAARLAYWVNAYNALTLRHVMRYPGLESVAVVPQGSPRYTFFKQKAHMVNGALRSLDEIEHQILRPIFKDPRVHAALNCASRSCPPLASTPYRAATIDAQLDTAARRFVNDSARHQLAARPPELSKIFEWFSEDFRGTSPSSHEGVIAFIKRFADPSALRGSALNQESTTAPVRVVFKPYDWALNGPQP